MLYLRSWLGTGQAGYRSGWAQVIGDTPVLCYIGVGMGGAPGGLQPPHNFVTVVITRSGAPP